VSIYEQTATKTEMKYLHAFHRRFLSTIPAARVDADGAPSRSSLTARSTLALSASRWI
jgi:hypothetical protein